MIDAARSSWFSKWPGVALAFMAWLAPAMLAQSIFTRAGGGSASVEGLPATSVLLSSVRGLAVDGAGNLYVSDEGTNTIYRIAAANGTITTFAGNGGGSFSGDGGPAKQAALKSPRGIAFDGAGNLYIADHDNGRVRRVAAGTGIITTVAGSDPSNTQSGNGDNGPATAAVLSGPAAVAWHNGALYIANDGYDENAIRKVDAAGVITTVAGKGPSDFSGDGGPAVDAGLHTPLGIALDEAGNLFIADAENHRVRRVDATTKIITTVIGGGTPSDGLGDGGPGTGAALVFPAALAFDAAGKLYVADAYHDYGRVRRWDPTTGIVTTVVGNGTYGGGDGGPAKDAGLYAPFALALDAARNLYVHDGADGTVRKVDATTQIITTIGGGGAFVGDGLPATSAVLQRPLGVAVDRRGNLFISDTEHSLVRKVDAATGVISTFAGILNRCCGADIEDGAPATNSQIGFPVDVAVGSDGSVYIADPNGMRVTRVDTTGKISVVAGGGNPTDGSGDGGPATSARISPLAVALDAADNLYIVDHAYEGPNRVRKVNAQTKQISTIAGAQAAGFAGDGGPATAALLNTPQGIAVDRAGNVYISDSGNAAIRRIDAANGTISTWAGRGEPADRLGDGQVATAAAIEPLHITIDRRNDDLLIADLNGHRVRKVDALTRIITTIAGNGKADFSGDNGAALQASLNFGYELSGIAVDADGRVFVADSKNNRVRAINACAPVGASTLSAPGDGEFTSIAPQLSWQNASTGDPSLRYDVYLSTDAAANVLFASDVTSGSLTLSNLQPGTKYFWRVVTKGDRFCGTPSRASSAIRSFTTTARCAAPGAFTSATPADGASIAGTSTQLSWSAAAGAGGYDVLFGTTNPPPFVASTSTTTFTVSDLAPGSTYYWAVVARSSCDREKTTATAVRSFQTAGACPTPGAVTLKSPAPGATGVAINTALEWAAAPNATSYDLSFGTSATPPAFLPNITTTSVNVSGLVPGQTYFWRVQARVACDPAKTSSSAIGSFTVRNTCAPAATPAFTFSPIGNVGVGQTYGVTWTAVADLAVDGYYVVERSRTADFAQLSDTQSTTATSASFVATTAGTLYHRVRAVNPCASTSTPSPTRSVTVVAAPPNVIFTVQPEAIVTRLGEKLEERRARFVLENLGDTPVSVIIGRQEIDSVPFFTIRDPLGGDASILELAPRTPKEMELRFSGPRTDLAGAYQGIIFLAALGKGLAVTPYAFVSLRVGGGDTAVPQFRFQSAPTEYAFFPGFAGDDAARPPITVDLYNPGTTPMEVAAEIGPELWLVPESGWNATPIPPGGTRTIKLFTRRNRAPNGSALPRYTFFRVRTRSGQTARLLVQDNDIPPTGAGRGAAVDAASRSVIVSEVVSRPPVRSTLRLSNIGSEAIQTELYFTPAGADGLDASRVRRATIAIPANDVVALNDPLSQLWGLPTPTSGQIEVRTEANKTGLLGVTSDLVTTTQNGVYGASSGIHVRGEGASIERPHVLFGISSTSRIRPVLTLAETSGTDRATVRVMLDDKDGNRKGERVEELARFGSLSLDEIATLLGASTIEGARIQLEVTSGGGSVVGVLKLFDRVTGGGVTTISTPLLQPAVNNLRGVRSDAEDSRSYFLPAVINSPSGGADTIRLQTTVGLVALGGPASFSLTYRDATRTRTATTNVGAAKTVEFANVLEQLLGVPAGEATEGSLLIETTGNGRVYGRLMSSGSLASVSQDLTIIGSESELVTSPTSQRPIYLDGLSQALDATQGSNWSLWLTELSGAAGNVIVRLYEAGNRTTPIAEKQFPLTAFRTVGLQDLFASMNLTSQDRAKDRANMLLSVTYANGGASVAAIARMLDKSSLATRSFALAPAGVAPLTLQKVSIVPPPAGETTGPAKRRGVRH